MRLAWTIQERVSQNILCPKVGVFVSGGLVELGRRTAFHCCLLHTYSELAIYTSCRILRVEYFNTQTIYTLFLK